TDLAYDAGNLYMAVGTPYADGNVPDATAANAVYRCENPNANNPSWYVGDGNGPAHNNYQTGGQNTFPPGNRNSARNRVIKIAAHNGTLYAAITSPFTQRLLQIVKSTNGGKTWAATGAQPPNYLGNPSPQGDFDTTIVIDQTDPTNNTVYVAGCLDYNTNPP